MRSVGRRRRRRRPKNKLVIHEINLPIAAKEILRVPQINCRLTHTQTQSNEWSHSLWLRSHISPSGRSERARYPPSFLANSNSLSSCVNDALLLATDWPTGMSDRARWPKIDEQNTKKKLQHNKHWPTTPSLDVAAQRKGNVSSLNTTLHSIHLLGGGRWLTTTTTTHTLLQQQQQACLLQWSERKITH